MRLTILSLLLLTTFTYSQITIELYLPDVDGTEYDNQSVKLWDANSNEYYGERFTVNSRVVFDNITSVETEPVSYIPSAGFDPSNKIIYFNSSVSGKTTIVVSDILGQTRKTESYIKAGRTEVKISELNLSGYSSGFYALRIITPAESYSLGLLKTGEKFSSTKAVQKQIVKERVNKISIADEIKIEVTHTAHYKRTTKREKEPQIEDYVVGYVDQMKTDSTAVTPEEFKQYCHDFNFDGASNMGKGLKSFFPNEDKKIWVLSTSPPGTNYTFNAQQINDIKDLVESEIYPYMAVENRPAFLLDDPSNPYDYSELPIGEPGNIFVYPRETGYNFSVNGDPETNVITWGSVQLDDDLDIANSFLDRRATLEEVASCFMGPMGNQGPPYLEIRTIFNGGNRMHPIDIKLIQMTQKLPTKTQIDDVLGIE